MRKLLNHITPLLAGGLFYILHFYLLWDLNSAVIFSSLLWMVMWWVLEYVPLAVTSLLPVVIFPLFKTLTFNEIGAAYGNKIIFLFLGGFIIALALEKSRLHLRIALGILNITGSSGRNILLGFLIVSSFLSMWISNTATTLMMLPIAFSIVDTLKKELSTTAQPEQFAKLLYLIIAFSASIGGMGTIIGTPPNAIFLSYLNSNNISLSFFEWMTYAIPIVLLLLGFLYFIFAYIYLKTPFKRTPKVDEELQKSRRNLGPMSSEEKWVASIFMLTVVLWISNRYLNPFLPVELNDSSIAIFSGILMFLIPSSKPVKGKDFMLKWEDSKQISWGILLLFGGGIALAKAFQKTPKIDEILAYLAHIPMEPWLILLIFLVFVVFITEVMSNTALSNIALPLFIGLGLELGYDNYLYSAPMAIAASCAFMLPMATAPNAIVFSSGKVGMKDMIQKGLILNLISIVIIWAYALLRL